MGLRCVCGDMFSCHRALAHWHISTLTHCGLRPAKFPFIKLKFSRSANDFSVLDVALSRYVRTRALSAEL